MADAKHTPGPWATQINVVNYRSGRRALEVRGKDDELVATLPGRGSDAVDGRLIAAAPELLELAARLTLATNEGDDQAQGTHYVDKQGVIRCKGSFLTLIEEARAAIAKATGSAA